MSNKTQRGVFLGMFAVALGIMAGIATVASAQWLENGVAINSNKKVEITHHTLDLGWTLRSKVSYLHVKALNTAMLYWSRVRKKPQAASKLKNVKCYIKSLKCRAA